MKPNTDRTMREARLSGFAKSHFIISGIGFVVLLPLYAVFSQSGESIQSHWCAVFVSVACLLMLMYFFAGFWCAQKKQWGSFCDRKEGLWAFLDPALIAWGWAAFVILSMFLDAWGLMLILFFASIFLASPSSLIVLLTITSPVMLIGWPGFFLIAFLAGGVPPLLFFLGSLFAGKARAAGSAIAESGV